MNLYAMKTPPYLLSAMILCAVIFSFSSCADDEKLPIVEFPTVLSMSTTLAEVGDNIVIQGYNLNENLNITINNAPVKAKLVTQEEVTFGITSETSSGPLRIEYEGDTLFTQYLSIKDSDWSIKYTIDKPIYSNDFVSVSMGFLSDGNTIYKANASGLLPVHSDVNLYPLHAIDEQTLFVHHSSWEILKTNDAGSSWEVIDTPTDFLSDEIYFENVEEGFAIGSDSNHETSVIFKTTDGGVNWEMVYSTPDRVFDYNGTKILSVSENLKIIVAGKSNLLIKSTDGGDTWTTEPLNLNAVVMDDDYFYFKDANVGWASLNQGIFKTINGGETWVQVEIPFKDNTSRVTGIKFFDDLDGMVMTRNGGFAKTQDGGESWEIFYTGFDIAEVDYDGYNVIVSSDRSILTKHFY